MAKPEQEQEQHHLQSPPPGKRKPKKGKDLGLSCMLNTEVSAVLAVIRKNPDTSPQFHPSPEEHHFDTFVLTSLKSLHSLIFNLHQEWRSIDPSIYLSPFLAVIQADGIPAPATGVALSSILKILKLGIFDEETPHAGEAIQSVVSGIKKCRLLEGEEPNSEEAVLMRILQVLIAIIKNKASVLLTDRSVCDLVHTCFQVVQLSAGKSDLLQRNARYTMHELIQAIFARLPEIDPCSDSDPDGNVGYGVHCMVDIFQFLCSLLNVMENFDSEAGSHTANFDEDIQLFTLVLINSAIELAGESIGKYKKLLGMIEDDLFHHAIYCGPRSSPLVLSTICSIVLNLYTFLRASLRLQLEAFFSFVLLRIAGNGNSIQHQEVAIEGILSFCRQPTFLVEMYVNFDCDPVCRNVFEDIVKLLCKNAYPVTASPSLSEMPPPLSSIQIQSFKGLAGIIQNIADNIDEDDSNLADFSNAGPIEVPDYRPFWTGKCRNYDDPEIWVEFVRVRKYQKKKAMIAAHHFNRDEKKGLEFLKKSNLIPDPPDPQSLAHFFRYTPGLDKTMIGDFVGDPDEFHIQVLSEFTGTFQFSGVILDTALRNFLETFRLPGESQKIQRILEAFAEKFYEQQSSEIFVDKDAVFILCYSLIMLNTDQHNAQVKKKMTEEEFIRNNRAINGGKDLPREYLSELFQSISSKEITLFEQSGPVLLEMNSNRWDDLIRRSAKVEPFIVCNFESKLTRDLFAAIAGPSVAALAAVFDHTVEEEMLHECIETFISMARISRYRLEDILDELITCLCKFPIMLNPYAQLEETLFPFTDLKMRMATVAVFTTANRFGDWIRGGWRNILDCLLNLKRLKLLPQSVIEPQESLNVTDEFRSHSRSETGVIFPRYLTTTDSSIGQYNTGRRLSILMGRFSVLSLENNDESTSLGMNEFEKNLQLIKQCRIGDIFNENSNLHEDSLQNLGRALIFAAAGKGQKFNTPVEEEETVGFCWELLVAITVSNLHRFPDFWPGFHDYLMMAAHFPLFSPSPFVEKAINGLLRICLKLIPMADKVSEELIFKSVNLTWKLDKEVLDVCCEPITHIVSRMLNESAAKIQTQLGWKTILHLLTITARHPETFDEGVEALITFMADSTYITKLNYSYCIESAFGFAALKVSPIEKSMKLLDLMADSINCLIKWYTSGYSDPGSNVSSTSNSSLEEGSKSGVSGIVNLFLKVAEALRKTSLVRREELRNHSIVALQRCLLVADELGFTPSNWVTCFNLVIFAMVDDLYEKMTEYSRRENAERETRSMEGTLQLGLELLAEVFLQFLKPISEYPGFKIFWQGILRRMGTCMKANLGGLEDTKLQGLVPEILKKMVMAMKEKEILVQGDGDGLWDTTYIQIQYIAPSLKDELFPHDF